VFKDRNVLTMMSSIRRSYRGPERSAVKGFLLVLTVAPAGPAGPGLPDSPRDPAGPSDPREP